jgi:hypothetical protein
MNARFWTYAHGYPVKITLRPGETRTHHTYSTDCEGWSLHAHVWTFDGETVSQETIYDGVDCDGRSTATYRDACPRSDLQALHSGDEPPMPDWRDQGSAHRDFAAEAAGY